MSTEPHEDGWTPEQERSLRDKLGFNYPQDTPKISNDGNRFVKLATPLLMYGTLFLVTSLLVSGGWKVLQWAFG